MADLAQVLATTFPGAEDAPLARALLRLLVRAEPVTDIELADTVGRRRQEIRAVLRSWPNVHRDERGRVVAFSGLSLSPTEHRFEVDGQRLFTWCAWDPLFLPSLLGAPASVESLCPITRARVQVRVTADGITHAEPADVWVSFPPADATSTADIVRSFCCHVHFIAGQAAAEQWLRGNAGGRVLRLADAFEVGMQATAALRT